MRYNDACVSRVAKPKVLFSNQGDVCLMLYSLVASKKDARRVSASASASSSASASASALASASASAFASASAL